MSRRRSPSEAAEHETQRTDFERSMAEDGMLESERLMAQSQRPAVVHIRRRLRRSRSTNLYLDTSDRSRGTYCGATMTSYDVDWRTKAASVTMSKLCPECAILRDMENGV